MNEEIARIKRQWHTAYDLVSEVFKDKVDKGGKPYIGHLTRVWSSVEKEKEQKCLDEDSTLSLFYEKACVVALLHDIVEDTDITLDDLRAEGFDGEILVAVDAITRRKEENKYFDFIERVKKNDLARIVKIHDLEDNMDIRRLTKFEDYEQKRLKKYFYCWKYLKGEIIGMQCNNIIHPDRMIK